MKDIFTKILYETEKNNDVMLVTLINSDGSAPRKTGAQMLVDKNGLVLGTIGGGAVELRSIQMAKEMLQLRQSGQHEFRLHSNETEDIGMICGGDVTACFRFIGADDPTWQDLCGKALELLSAQQGGWFVQNLSGKAPSLLDSNGKLICGETTGNQQPTGNTAQTLGENFWMPLPVPERVLIFGGVHISAALVPLLRTVGFRSWVFDDRPEFTTPERFPQAEKCLTIDFAHIENYVDITDEDYVVIMTNGHKHDFEAELHVLRGDFAYIGVIGSKKKTMSVNERLRENGISEDAIAKVHTPIGTAIKAVTPEEIAVSIAGELILVRAERREAAGTVKKHCPMH